ncbi:MAG: ABC transporter permease [Oscillospiraceae bacterium]|jgi:putative ABC transport system permease protein|nr:ABC transporter permease [Oscillospiraceae bacterium]
MKLTAKLALAQIEKSKSRTLWTMLGILLCVAMVTAICGFAASGMATFNEVTEGREKEQVRLIMITLASVFGGIVALASVIVVSNAFRASAGERTNQFGLLKSTGATKKQIAATVMYEGLFFSAIGIPIGVLLGVLIQYTGLSIANGLLGYVNNFLEGGDLVLRFTLSPVAIAAAAVASFATVMLSAWLPARRAARIPAIDAIRRTGDVKLKRKSVKTSRLVQLLFRVEGTLAAKSLRRSRRNFRATVVSITISIVMMLAAASLHIHMTKLTDTVMEGINATAAMTYSPTSAEPFRTLSPEDAERMTGQLRAYGGASVFGLGADSSYQTNIDGKRYDMQLIAVERVHYEELCREAGVTAGSVLLYNEWRVFDEGKYIITTPFGRLAGRTLTASPADINGAAREYTIAGVLDEVPNEILSALAVERLYLIVPDIGTPQYVWYVLAEDAADFLLYAESAGNEFRASLGLGEKALSYINYQTQEQVSMRITNLVTVFVNGFVGLLILIGLTNVISTVSTNVRLRKREFAMLQSVGMTRGGLSRMLTLESILCSVRALLFGLPLGIFAAWLVYTGVIQGDYRFPFTVPWLAIAECVLGVFAVTFVSMRFAASRLRKQNTVETIRAEDGV